MPNSPRAMVSEAGKSMCLGRPTILRITASAGQALAGIRVVGAEVGLGNSFDRRGLAW